MKRRETIQWLVGLSVNLTVIIFLIKAAWEGNDKAMLLVLFFYPVLIVINSLVWLVLRTLKKSDARIYGTLAVWLTILFVPVLLIAAMY